MKKSMEDAGHRTIPDEPQPFDLWPGYGEGNASGTKFAYLSLNTKGEVELPKPMQTHVKNILKGMVLSNAVTSTLCVRVCTS
jgi:hypothetical protein